MEDVAVCCGCCGVIGDGGDGGSVTAGSRCCGVSWMVLCWCCVGVCRVVCAVAACSCCMLNWNRRSDMR